jgi:hypothetical protein
MGLIERQVHGPASATKLVAVGPVKRDKNFITSTYKHLKF